MSRRTSIDAFAGETPVNPPYAYYHVDISPYLTR